ncbi:flagellar basal body-associated FliL family protein [Aquisalibacillus elongatus]|uniref:Flagellar protein FliL n=1 Tax=Aquisalibacillus elongatus TaxID=485577 RepID=A0A3N5BEV4_9BACI|nr:flagellar basal body-associated FliL family protein [Aquisalibacillus elongatus]RPF55987.1 flagellar FliL protein [Aquisalibacillus elongatus]
MSKPIKLMVTTLIALTLVGVIAVIVLLYMDTPASGDSEPTIDEQVENSFETEEITTDLSDDKFIRIRFRIITDNESTKERLQKGENFQLNNAIIKTITVKESNDFRSGLDNIEEAVRLKLNNLLDDGLVTKVLVTDKVLQ